MSFYSRDIIRRVREREQDPAASETALAPTLASIPAEAPMDDATITVWNGERWVAYDQWRRTRAFQREAAPADPAPLFPANAVCVTGVCGERRVWLSKDGERWLMFVGSRKARGRRRDFATPFLAHAIRTAEAWYGAPRAGWRAEDEKAEAGNQGSSREDAAC